MQEPIDACYAIMIFEVHGWSFKSFSLIKSWVQNWVFTPWIMAGDFNKPLVDEDKFGGRGVSVRCSFAFKECLDRCSMVDLRFSRLRYTWKNKRDINNLILERIDRVFMNPEWCAFYLDAKVTHLPKCHSDHYPILLEACLVIAMHLTRPFKFQEFWLSNISFPNVVSKAWGRN